MNRSHAKRIAFDQLKFAPRFAYGEQAGVVEVTGTGEGSKLGTGFARFTNAELPWTVKYDEVILVIEGSLMVRGPEGDLVANPLDCIWLPKGTALTYCAENALVFYAIHPADWLEAEE